MAPADRGQHGFSLVESVIAIAILGLIVAAMVGGMATMIATSDIHRQQSVVNAVMVSAAENLKSAPYISTCSSAPNAVYAVPAPATVRSIDVSVQYWNSTSFGTCSTTGSPTPFPMQLVRLTVTGNRNNIAWIEIVKRGP